MGPLNIPLLADVTRSLSHDYGVLKEDEGIAYRYCGPSGGGDYSWRMPSLPPTLAGGRSSQLLTVNPNLFRGLFIIDGKGVLRQITVNDLPVGRSVDEALRLVQAFQYTDEHGEGEQTCSHVFTHGDTLSPSVILLSRHSLPALAPVWDGCGGPKEESAQGLVCRKYLVWWGSSLIQGVGGRGGGR